MVDVLIGEMVGSDRSSTRKIAASLWCWMPTQFN